LITEVGPADKDDLPKKRGFWGHVFRFLYVASGMAWMSRILWFVNLRGSMRAMDMVNKDDEQGFHYSPPAGIPEADLTERERKEAAEQLRWQEKK
jgi:hypothetical protein